MCLTPYKYKREWRVTFEGLPLLGFIGLPLGFRDLVFRVFHSSSSSLPIRSGLDLAVFAYGLYGHGCKECGVFQYSLLVYLASIHFSFHVNLLFFLLSSWARRSWGLSSHFSSTPLSNEKLDILCCHHRDLLANVLRLSQWTLYLSSHGNRKWHKKVCTLSLYLVDAFCTSHMK